MRAERSARVIQRRNKPRHTQIATIRTFCIKLCVISPQFKIFRCLYAVFTALCVQNVVHAFSIIETSPGTRKSQSFVNLSKIVIYFSPVWDISTFKRYFHCIMRAERSARVIRRRNKPKHTQIATVGRFWRKLSSISLPFEIFRSLNALFTESCVQNVVHALSSVETGQDTRKSQSFVDFEAN